MTARINLLKTTEYRRQGLVSTAFIIRVSIMTVVLLALVFGALAFLQRRNARQTLDSARELWRVREPLYRKTLAMKQDLATKRKLDQELRGWSASRIAWNEPLAEFQEITLPTLQFRRLNVRGEMDVRVPKVKTPKAGSAEAKPAEAAAPALAAGTPARRFFLLIEGRAEGDQAEDAVLQFDAALRRAPGLRALMESVRLQRLESEESRAGGAAGQVFAIEAATARREMP
ncbi:MAG TPA: hypothetical protein P5567_04300 [Kiritimatiellia bacterium]|nr:hypothetical protein [Kiritimatiellia bacterium]HRZ11659.1 hypothetical protein [Kiritimatiellia bacterium]HSA16790.1 hypothetical protein [Kiritimatiellia bacterium]